MGGKGVRGLKRPCLFLGVVNKGPSSRQAARMSGWVAHKEKRLSLTHTVRGKQGDRHYPSIMAIFTSAAASKKALEKRKFTTAGSICWFSVCNKQQLVVNENSLLDFPSAHQRHIQNHKTNLGETCVYWGSTSMDEEHMRSTTPLTTTGLCILKRHFSYSTFGYRRFYCEGWI